MYTCVLYKNYEDRNTATSPTDKAKVIEGNTTSSQVTDTIYRWEDNRFSFTGFDTYDLPFAVWKDDICILRSSCDIMNGDRLDMLDWALEWKEKNTDKHLDLAIDQWIGVRVEYDGQPIGTDDYWGYEDSEAIPDYVDALINAFYFGQRIGNKAGKEALEKEWNRGYHAGYDAGELFSDEKGHENGWKDGQRETS